MLNIKTFKDGERLVVVLEGLDQISETEIVGKYLQTIGNITNVRPAEVEPLKPHNDELVPNIPIVIQEGIFSGKTPEEVLTNEEAFQELIRLLHMETEDSLRENIKKECRKYLKKKFASSDASEYARKLSDKQVSYFYVYYEDLIDNKIKKELCNTYKCSNYTKFLLTTEVLRDGVEYLINTFKN